MSDRTIRTLIEQLSGAHLSNKVYAVDAIVLSVDETLRICSCQVVSGQANNIISNVRLMAAVDDGVLIIPEVESSVCLIISDKTEPYISQYSEVKKIILLGGELGGLVKVIELTEKLNNLENKVNSLLTVYNTHTHNVTAVGAPTGPNLSPEPGQLVVTDRDNIENKSITHGNF